MKQTKTIGIVLPMSALVSSKAENGAFEAGEIFLKWLYKNKQTAWQLLPLHQTQLETGSPAKRVPSPYKSYGIGLNPCFLSKSFKKKTPGLKELKKFKKKQSYWLTDYVLFCALSDHFKTDDWTKWTNVIRNKKKSAIKIWSKKLKEQINRHIVEQWQLHQEYESLKKYASSYGIKIFGDLSFYLPHKSPLVWAYQNLFKLNSRGIPLKVSGIPDGPKAHFGRQVWGHPLYHWGNKKLTSKIIKIWKIRLAYNAQLFDWIRIDHAKGLFLYGSMDPDDQSLDTILPGPGTKALKELINFAQLKKIKIFAEDSGDGLSGLRKTLKELKVPGIRILRFALNEKTNKIDSQYARVDKYPKNSVVYTTTHDTETLLTYIRLLSSKQKKGLAKELQISDEANEFILAKKIISRLIKSPAQVVMIPLQDCLLTTDRINIPGTEKEHNDPNWHYQMNVPIEKLPTLNFD